MTLVFIVGFLLGHLVTLLVVALGFYRGWKSDRP
jgi:hypothetical protein